MEMCKKIDNVEVLEGLQHLEFTDISNNNFENIQEFLHHLSSNISFLVVSGNDARKMNAATFEKIH